jgi:hypothetical protein
MKNQDIPADKINEYVAEMQSWADSQDYPPYSHIPPSYITIEEDDCCYVHCAIDDYDPLTNHAQFHELWTADMEAKACAVLDGWLRWYESLVPEPGYRNYRHNSEYKANRRLWQLRAVCEVMGNEG